MTRFGGTPAKGIRHLLLFPVGVGCMVIGVAGFVLPIVPGWPFFFVGLSILAPRAAVRFRKSANLFLFKPKTVHLEDWQKLGIHAGFTTKHFPLILKKTDEWLDLSNQNRFKELFWKTHLAMERDKGSSGRFVILNQVHGDRVLVLDDAKKYDQEAFYHFPEADGVITNVPRLTLLVLTADCLPVFLSGAGWTGLVHAGWRGTRAGIVENAVRLLCERSGSDPHDVHAAFGPCIGKARYEVGEEFGGYFKGSVLERRRNKLYFDLAGENRRQLMALGLQPDRVSDLRLCTVAGNRHFYSFRKEREAAGRTISFITKL